MYLCVFDPYAVKDLKKFPDYIQSAILQKIDYFISSDHPLDFAKKWVITVQLERNISVICSLHH